MHKYHYLCERFKDSPKQGTDEWKENRKKQFGGSEIGALLEHNPYMTRTDLILQKQNGEEYKDNVCTLFGKMFEPVAKAYLRQEKKITILEMGSIPSSSYPISYSPDGFIVANKDQLMLLEIKCPIYQQKCDEIKPYYLDQVKTGMSILPVDGCYFMIFKFRKCSIDQLKGDKLAHDRPFHKAWKDKNNKKLQFYGYLLWEDPKITSCFDLGVMGEDKFCQLNMNYKINFNSIPCEDHIKGLVLPFKCYYVDVTILPLTDTFLAIHKDDIWKGYEEMCEKQKNKGSDCKVTDKVLT
jgi:putative phage-type endonuclease